MIALPVRCVVAILSGLAVIAVTPAVAEPPQINAIAPPVAQRGVESSLRFFGRHLAGPVELIAPFAARVKPDGNGNEYAGFVIEPDATTPPGVYPVRLRSAGGVSNLRLLAVTDVPVQLARTDVSGLYRAGRLQLEQAQPVNWPVAVTGGRLQNHVDLFRFSVDAGQRLVFVSQSRRLGLTPDLILRLRDANGRTLALAHDTPGLKWDERIDHTFAEAGDGYLEVHSTEGAGWNNHYMVKLGDFNYARSVFPLGGRRGEDVRLQVTDRDGRVTRIERSVPDDAALDDWRLTLDDLPGSLPWTLAVGDHPESLEEELSKRAAADQPPLVNWPVTINGQIDEPDQQDVYRIPVQSGEQIRVRIDAYHLGSALDAVLLVYDPVGKQLLASNDDRRGRGHPDPDLSFPVPDGLDEVTIAVRDAASGGGINHGYRLTVERGGPDFYLWLGRKQHPTNKEDDGWSRMDLSDTLNIPAGGETRLLISARRDAKRDDPHYRGAQQGYNGPIRIRAEHLPKGVTVEPAVIEPDATQVELVCRATADATSDVSEIVIVGEGQRPDGSRIRRTAERRLYISDPQMPHLAWNWRVRKVTCAVVRPTESAVREE